MRTRHAEGRATTMSVRMLSRLSSQPGGEGGGAVLLLSSLDDSPTRENCSEDERIAKVPSAPYKGEDLSDGLAKQVVVVGVISRLKDEASQLLDRVLLAQVFAGRKCCATNPNARVGRKGHRGN